MATQTVVHPALKNISALAKLMDAQFRIPGTNIRFGLDALMGLIPGVGDIAGLAISGYMLSILAKNGASGYVLGRMILNILIDAMIGAIPVLGDLFDIGFKANLMNLQLMKEHYVEGRHKGGAWKIIVPVILLLSAILAIIGWITYKILIWLF